LLLRLFVAGDGPNSREAVANLEAICRRSLESDAHQLEIIDVLEEPLRALEEGILVTPTLVAYNSPPVSIVGTLRDHQQVMRAIGLRDEQKEH
jgi:circadian clock protein KaiB